MDQRPSVERDTIWKNSASGSPGSTIRIIVELTLGVIIPILLLIFDPIVFRSQISCLGPGLVDYSLFAYMTIGFVIIALLVWKLWGVSLEGATAAFVAGILLLGGALSILAGVLILPYSVPGLIVLIGVFGFLPFLISFVYFFNGNRAYQRAFASTTSPWRPRLGLIGGCTYLLVVPFVVHSLVASTIQTAVTELVDHQSTLGSADSTVDSAIVRLINVDQLCLHLCTPLIAADFNHATKNNSTLQTDLGPLYRQISGQNLVNTNCSMLENSSAG